MIILASKSPRRKELLSKIIKDFKIIPTNIDENAIEGKTPKETTLNIALAKGEIIHKKYPNDVVISADTIVVINNQILGKPVDEKDAIRMLKTLSDNTHEVITGYAIFKDNLLIKNTVSSFVTFNNLDESLILKYVSSRSPLDKAGAYGVQDNDEYHIIKEVKGSTYNVIGFPLEEIEEKLKLNKLI